MTKEILLIDDDEDELDVFDQALRSIDKSIQCRLAKDLDEAVALCSEYSPGYIFIDFNMPVQNGLECLSALKNSGNVDGARVILYSNHIDEELTAKALTLGAFRCIRKPNMISVLARKLKDILEPLS